jgi:hypothetical protein
MPTPESVKVTSEPPSGLAHNISLLLSTFVEPLKYDVQSSLAQRFTLVLFATLTQERKFGPLS